MRNLKVAMMSSVIRHVEIAYRIPLLFISMQVLWPCLHYAIPDAPKSKVFYESDAFKQYVAVNQRFADAIVANYREGDISQFLFIFTDII
jgi:trehalose-6-phosphate synthase